MKVAVLMPVYNHLAFLPKAVESILNQTHQDLTLFIIDDGSTEDVADYIYGLADSRIDFYRRTKSAGLTRCLNMMLDRASRLGADVFARQDSDDWSEPTRIAQQLARLQGTVGLVTTYAQAHNANGKPIANDYCDRIARPSEHPDPERLRSYNILIDASSLFTRKAFGQIGHYDERLYIGQTYNYHLRIAQAGFEIRVMPTSLYHVRKHSDQVRHRMRGKIQLDGEECNRKCREWAKANPVIW